MKVNKSTHCLNCGTPLGEANYCPHCGQLNSDRKVSLRRLFSDFFGDYFSFDSRIFHSLRPLMIKPGYLTRQYLAGRRVSYILPLRFYIFTTAVLFLLISLRGYFNIGDQGSIITFESDSSSSDTLVVVDSSLVEEDGVLPPSDITIAEALSVEDTLSLSEAIIRDLEIELEDSSLVGDGLSFFARKVAYLETLGEKGTSVLGKEMLKQMPKIFFLLLPLFALILKLLYLRRRIYFVEHLVFALHFHTFLFLILILVALLPFKYLVIALFLGTFPYLFQSLRVVYRQSLLKTAIKFLLLFVLYSFCLLPAALALLFLSLATV